jgi:uncharacterized protein with HEPN domain
MPPETQPLPHDVKRLEHIVKSAQDAIEIVGDLTARELLSDMIRARALVNCFTEIGEAAARLSDSARTLVGELPWRQIIGMRNIIVHVYWASIWTSS